MPRKKKFHTSLPSLPCTNEMRQAVIEVAEDRNLNLVDVMREAISLFLLKNDTKSINSDTITSIQEAIQA